MTELEVPELSLVVLIGVSGSGKSTFARERFKPTEVISSDFCRGLVADDENDQSASADAFELLHFIVGKRLAAGRLTVVDATNVQLDARRALVALAREHDVLPAALVLDVPESVCRARNASRPDRDFGDHVIRRQHADLRRSLRGLQKEGFRTVHVLRGEDEIAAATITRTRLFNDLRHETGPFDVIGDIHGCAAELRDAARRARLHDQAGRVRPGDRCQPPGPPRGLRRRSRRSRTGHAGRAAAGHGHGRRGRRAVRAREPREQAASAPCAAGRSRSPTAWPSRLPSWRPSLTSSGPRPSGSWTAWSATTSSTAGSLVVSPRRADRALPRAARRAGSASSACTGRRPARPTSTGCRCATRGPASTAARRWCCTATPRSPTPEWVNNTLCLDTGCVFGGRLTALRYPETGTRLRSGGARCTTSRPGRSRPTRRAERGAAARPAASPRSSTSPT